MCEKRTMRIKKGSQIVRLREARRLQRLQRLASLSTSDESRASPQVDKSAQNRLLLELAWKTIALMHKNRLIQQKIVALQKETSEFVAAVMSNPENKRRYLEHVRLYGGLQQTQTQENVENNNNLPIKVEPGV